MHTNMAWELSAPIGMTTQRHLPLGAKNARRPREASSTVTCQYPETISVRILTLASGGKSLTASSHLGMGNLKGRVTRFRARYDTHKHQSYSCQGTCFLCCALVASTINAPHGPSSSSMRPFSASFWTRPSMTVIQAEWNALARQQNIFRCGSATIVDDICLWAVLGCA